MTASRFPSGRLTAGLCGCSRSGRSGLRKGSPYVAAVARSLRGRAVFRWSARCRRQHPPGPELAGTVDITGPVSRSGIREHYAWADVFFLPSICEGSATAVYEALTAGLPVICTANTGSVVRDGLDGFIVPIRAVEAMVDRIERLARGREPAPLPKRERPTAGGRV